MRPATFPALETAHTRNSVLEAHGGKGGAPGPAAQPRVMRLIASARDFGVLLEQPADRRRDRARAGLLDAAHRHAHVLAVEHDDHAARVQRLVDSRSAICDVSRSCTCGRRLYDLDQPGQLGQAGDAAVACPGM